MEIKTLPNTLLKHEWLIKLWFSASTFMAKISTFARPETETIFEPLFA
jgi:hypothetical protein